MQVASLPQLPDVGNLEARLTFNFQRENSCLIKATLTVVEMQDIHGVANKLGKLDEWENRFRVVSAAYTGEKCMILAAREANTTVEVSGTVDVLKQVELGKVEVKPSISSSNECIFKSVGDTGVVGLRLFKLGWLFDGPKLLGPGGEVPIHDTWGADLEDDL